MYKVSIPIYAANVLMVIIWWFIDSQRVWLATYFFFDTIRTNYFRARANSWEAWDDIWVEVASEAICSSMNTGIFQTKRSSDLYAFWVLGDADWEQVWQLELEVDMVKVIERCLIREGAWKSESIYAEFISLLDSDRICLTGRKPDVNVSSIVIDNRERKWCSVIIWHIK